MRYRMLGNTGLSVSEIGLGAEWLERHSREECKAIIQRCQSKGINILDCWMSEPNVRTNIGAAIKGSREKWIIQGHVGSIWENGQYTRSRDPEKIRPAFEDLLARLDTDYVDLGMMHFIDSPEEFTRVIEGPFYAYMRELLSCGKIRHIGMSTHNPAVGKMAVLSGKLEMILFSINPAFDMMPPSEDIIDRCFADQYDDQQNGIDPVRAEFYKLCEQNGVGLTVMKGYAGGRLFNAETSPFGVALTPVQCLHYALTRPAVASVLAGYNTPDQVDAAVAYETATDEEKDYASVLAGAPKHAYAGQCTYCGHCAPCPKSIDIALVNKYSDLAAMYKEIPSSLKDHYDALSAHASDCIACGGCEKRCPFGVNVVEKMRGIRQLFGK